MAEGESRFEGLRELRVKESDRLAIMINNLQAAGVDCEIIANDGAIVSGKGYLPELKQASKWLVEHDHRLAMTGVVAGLCSPSGIEVSDVDAVAVSWPNFMADIYALMQTT
jgi:3-phosphoshikimate 1-carboxyvinyltransferase